MKLSWISIALICLASCGRLGDVIAYETTTTVERFYSAPPALQVRAKLVRPDLAAQLQSEGFTSFLKIGGDELLAEWYPAGRSTQDAGDIKSISKVLVSLLLDKAVEAGHTALNREISTIDGCRVPESLQPLTPSALVNMSAGFAFDENKTAHTYARPGWACAILGLPVEAKTGSRFNYATAQTHLLALHLQDVTGQPLEVQLHDILRPMGIGLDGWRRTQDGDLFGGTDLWMQPRDLARLGQVFLERGIFQADTVLPLNALSHMSNPTFKDVRGRDVDYGHGWWHHRLLGVPVSVAEGVGGQILAIVPSLDRAFVFTAPSRGPRAVRDHDRRVDVALSIVSAHIAQLK